MNKLPKSDMKQVAVLGLGRFGIELAKALGATDCEVLAVDRCEERIYEVADYVTHTVVADVSEERNLREIGITEFDCVVVAIGDDMQSSIITALNCKHMGVEYIVAKAQTAQHAEILEKIGVDYIVIPEADSAMKTARLLTQPQIDDIISVTADYSIAQVAVPSDWAGRKLSELNLRSHYGVNVLIVITNGGINTSPAADTVLAESDRLVIGGMSSDIKTLAGKLK